MTITVRLPEQIEAELRARLADNGQALSVFVREAIAEKLAREHPQPKPTAYELGRDLFGRHGSGRSDLSENAERILRERLGAKHRG